MKKSYLLSLVVATILFTGCGGTNSGTTDASTDSNTFTVERGPILGAQLADANGTLARELGNGQYIFDQAVEYPVISTGGYIDVNRNGTVDAGEVKNTLHLETTEGNVVTLATTLSSNTIIKTFLVNDLGINEGALKNKLPGNDHTIEALSDAVFKYVMENDINNTLELSQDDLTQIQSAYRTRYNNYVQDGLKAAEHEADLINSMSIVTLDNAEAEAAEIELKQGRDADQNSTKHLDPIQQETLTDINTSR